MKNRLFIAQLLFLNVVIFTTFLQVPAFAESNPDFSEEKRGLISQNCGTIRQSLKLLQRSDSRARTYFGAIYETFSSKYLTPLNLRLVKNNISSVSLIKLQTSFAESRSTFSSDFIAYSKSLEELISTDCRLEPDLFYERLEKTREKRMLVSSDLADLNDALASSVSSIEKLKESL